VPEPDGRGGTTYRRVFRLKGGDVTILCGPVEVRVLTSKPAKGFSAVQTSDGPRIVRISFNSSKHTSRIYSTWRDGPYAEVTESV
jgi:hypothetical protein